MTFLYPLGFLGLIGIPVLIGIYILKNKYTEQTVTSTYIWTLSEKFLKKRLPINKLVGLISLILQIICVIAVSILIAHPVLYIKGAANDYCFVLDGSGSMNAACADGTRFDAAKGEIASVIDESYNGSAYTLVFAGNTNDVIFENITDKERALTLLNGVASGNTAADVADAVSVAQGYFNENPSVLTYLVTDKQVDLSENVTVITVGEQRENFALTGVGYTFADGTLTVTGKVLSYMSEAAVTVEVYLDGEETTESFKEIMVAFNEFTGLKEGEFSIGREVDKDASFTSVRVVIAKEDSLPQDNEIIIYDVAYENSCKTLLVSDKPFFILAMLKSIDNVTLTCVSCDKYAGQTGYDLYIFDSYGPSGSSGWTLPDDGAVWFFNPQSGLPNTGFSVQDEIGLTALSANDYKEDTALGKTLLQDVNKTPFTVAKYRQCRLYSGFTTILSANGNPVIFAGSNGYGNRQVVFAFDLHESDYALVADYITLSTNLLNYIFPTVLENSTYTCGETVTVNLLANSDSMRVAAPSGKINYFDGSNAVCEVTLTEIGTYTVTIVLNDKSVKTFNIYSSLPEEEADTVTTATASFSLSGEAGNEKRDGIYSELLIIFILFALIFAADWVVYCYEQYQLR